MHLQADGPVVATLGRGGFKEGAIFQLRLPPARAGPAAVMIHGPCLHACSCGHMSGDAHLPGPCHLSVIRNGKHAIAVVLHRASHVVGSSEGNVERIGVATPGAQVAIYVHGLDNKGDRDAGAALFQLVQPQHVLLVVHVGGGGVGDEGMHVRFSGVLPVGSRHDHAIQLDVNEVVAAYFASEMGEVCAVVHVLQTIANRELKDLRVQVERAHNLDRKTITAALSPATALVVGLDGEHHALPGKTLIQRLASVGHGARVGAVSAAGGIHPGRGGR
mmetsp:Transcript_32280/g.57778  ORF Transcript_32280/g.57778 Transcript_32280/m.57778 type:complete len:275 (-) Transcript_32280:238-1062(-)